MSAPTITSAGGGLPTRLIVHGVEGVGKTTLGAFAPKPIFGMSRGETGLLTLIDHGLVPAAEHFTPDFRGWSEVLQAVQHLIDHDTGHRTLALDTLNGLERLCLEFVCDQRYEGDWDKFSSYGRGPESALSEWNAFLALLDRLRERRKVGVICFAHTKVKGFRNPLGEDYDRYVPDLGEKTWGLAAKWADVVLFANFEVRARKGRGELKAKAENAAMANPRVLHTVRTAAWDAKNRLGLPPTIPMGKSPREGWDNLAAAMRKAREQARQPAPPQQQQPQAAAAGNGPPRERQPGEEG